VAAGPRPSATRIFSRSTLRLGHWGATWARHCAASAPRCDPDQTRPELVKYLLCTHAHGLGTGEDTSAHAGRIYMDRRPSTCGWRDYAPATQRNKPLSKEDRCARDLGCRDHALRDWNRGSKISWYINRLESPTGRAGVRGQCKPPHTFPDFTPSL